MDDIVESLKPVIIAIFIGIIILIIGYPKYHEYEKTHAEWIQKVNKCVMNQNYRPDCKLILYKDQQNAVKHGNTTTVVPISIYTGR